MSNQAQNRCLGTPQGLQVVGHDLILLWHSFPKKLIGGALTSGCKHGKVDNS